MVTDSCAIQYLCNFDDQLSKPENQSIEKLWSGQWSIENVELCKELLSSDLDGELLNVIRRYRDSTDGLENILHLAVSSLLTFCDQNWNPHPDELSLEQYLHMKWPENIDVSAKLQRDSEPLYTNILHSELLYFSHQIFSALYSVEQSLVHLWWCFRSKILHQRALEDTSATVYSELELIMAKLTNELQNLVNKPRLQILLCLEIAQAYLIYGRVQKVEVYLDRAREISGLKLELTGVLGKRTKFQQKLLPQLALSSELDSAVNRPTAEESHGSSVLPPDIELQDDVRLNKIHYEEKIMQSELPSLEQTLCLLTVQYIQKSQPKDDLMAEELQPYIETVVSQKRGPWSTRVAALLIRCRLEARHKRSVERAMLQCEAIVGDKTGVSPTDSLQLYIETVVSQKRGPWSTRVAALLIRCRLEARHKRSVERAMLKCEAIVGDKTGVSATDRLSYLWATGLPPAWTWRQQLADLYLSMGLVKAALELFQQLQLWEDVIVCYTMLQLRHKAAEVIQQQIEINPTVKLYCLLGDATDDVSYYEKAWDFSNHRSSRAQRHWGNFLFDHKRYRECIPHYEESVRINSIQESVWLRLGFAALQTEQWETSAAAYRRYTYLQPNSFEAWNNLAKVYVNQGDKPRAYRALMEALRFNYDNWKLWENVVTVSMDTGHFEDVIRGVHRLAELLGKFNDVEVLALLVRAALSDHKDADGNSVARLRKRILELFGRITSLSQNKPEIWQLYSDISPTYLLKAQRLLKAYRGYTQNGNWSNSPDTCNRVIELAQNLLDYSIKARKEAEDKDKAQCDQQLSSARLTGQAVIRAAEKQDWPETKEALEELKKIFNEVTEYMKSIM